jgi:hypothetical protein
MLLIGSNLEPPIGSRLLIFMTILLVILVPVSLINIHIHNVSALIGILLLYPITIFIVGPIIGFPIYFLHELLRRSRLPDFPRRGVSRVIGILFIVLIPLLIVSGQDISSMLLVTGSVYARLRYPRSPWPRILYVYGPSCLKQVLIGIVGIFLVGATMGLPNLVVKLASLLVPSLLLGWKLREVTRVHRGGLPRLPNRCILLLRPFGFDDENFAELNRGFFSILDPSHGAPFDTFVRSSVEKQLGTFVSFGDPGDIALRRGARRHYVTDTNWRLVFEELISKTTAFLAVVPTTSEGFIWELTRLRKLDLHTRLFLFTSPIRKFHKRPLLVVTYELISRALLPRRQVPNTENSWQHAALDLALIGYQLTEYPGPGSVIGFAADGTNMILARNCEEPSEFIAPIRHRLYSTVDPIPQFACAA